MLQFDFIPFPELKTERLLLRKLEHKDANEIFFLRSDAAVLQFIGKEPAATIQEAEEFIKTINTSIADCDAIMWGITLNENTAMVIGTICLWNFKKEHYRGELGYVLHPSYWGKGYMKEAIRSVIDYGFSVLQLHSIEALTHPGNTASAAVLESSGFVKEGYLKESFYFRGEFEDTVIYSLLK